MGAQRQPSVQPKNDWQGAGDQPAIVKMIVKKAVVDAGFDQPAVDGIGAAARQEERIAIITKTPHGHNA